MDLAEIGRTSPFSQALNCEISISIVDRSHYDGCTLVIYHFAGEKMRIGYPQSCRQSSPCEAGGASAKTASPKAQSWHRIWLELVVKARQSNNNRKHDSEQQQSQNPKLVDLAIKHGSSMNAWEFQFVCSGLDYQGGTSIPLIQFHMNDNLGSPPGENFHDLKQIFQLLPSPVGSSSRIICWHCFPKFRYPHHFPCFSNILKLFVASIPTSSGDVELFSGGEVIGLGRSMADHVLEAQAPHMCRRETLHRWNS